MTRKRSIKILMAVGSGCRYDIEKVLDYIHTVLPGISNEDATIKVFEDLMQLTSVHGSSAQQFIVMVMHSALIHNKAARENITSGYLQRRMPALELGGK